jgi:hypothetical protein
MNDGNLPGSTGVFGGPASSFFSRVSGIEFNNGEVQDMGTASCLPLFLLVASTVTVGYGSPWGWLLIDDRPML